MGQRANGAAEPSWVGVQTVWCEWRGICAAAHAVRLARLRRYDNCTNALSGNRRLLPDAHRVEMHDAVWGGHLRTSDAVPLKSGGQRELLAVLA